MAKKETLELVELDTFDAFLNSETGDEDPGIPISPSLDDIDVTWESSEPDKAKPDESDPDKPDEASEEEEPDEIPKAAATETADDEEFTGKFKKRLQREERIKKELREREAQLEAELAAEREVRQQLQARFVETQTQNIDQQLANLRAKYKVVRNEFDPEKADEELELLEKINQLQFQKQQATVEASRQPAPRTTPRTPPAKTEIAPLTRKWMDRNSWYGKQEYEVQTLAAEAIDRQLAAEGYDMARPDYFNELDRRLQKQVKIPGTSRPQRETLVQAGRDTQGQGGGKQSVRLTKEEMATMRKVGLDPTNMNHLKRIAREKLLLPNEGAQQ